MTAGDHGAHRFARSLWLLGLLALGWWGYEYLDARYLPVRSVALLSAPEHLERSELRGLVANYTGGGFLHVDLDALRRAIEGLDWVAQAKVRRLWPDGLAVTVTEHQVAAYWGDDGLLNGAGELFAHGQLAAPLPRLAGPPQSHGEVFAALARFRRQLRPLGLEVAAVTLDRRRAWRLRLGSGVEIRLGREHTRQRLQRFLRAYPQVVAREGQRARYVDMRYTNGLAVRWRRQDDGAAS